MILTKENSKPILFRAPLVRKTNECYKTETRRTVKNTQCIEKKSNGDLIPMLDKNPYGRPGDFLWVKETFGIFKRDETYQGPEKIIYRADSGWANADNIRDVLDGGKWKPSIFMPKAYSRTILQIESVHAERLQDITKQSALAEGIEFHPDLGLYGLEKEFLDETAVGSFKRLWTSINGEKSWDDNPWIWVIKYKKL